MKRYVVDQDGLRDNVRLLLEKAGDKTLWAVLKGDGYGLGLVPMARLLRQWGVDHFAVTEVREVQALREDGFDGSVLMMEGTCNPQEVQTLLELGAILTIGSQEDAWIADELARKMGCLAPVHGKIDTGMGRYGFLPSQVDVLAALYRECSHLSFSGIYTHFYNSSEPVPTQAQFRRFQGVLAQLREKGLELGMVHCCNSSAFLKYPEMHCDGVRVGSALLGRVTIGGDTGLHRIGDCQAELEEIRTIPAGHTVGYGAGWKARRETRIGVLSVGYFHGFAVDRGYDLWRWQDCARGVARYVKAFLQRRALYVTVNGKPCRVLGHVGMVNMVIDITDCDCALGDLAHVNINPLLLKGVEIQYL